MELAELCARRYPRRAPQSSRCFAEVAAEKPAGSLGVFLNCITSASLRGRWRIRRIGQCRGIQGMAGASCLIGRCPGGERPSWGSVRFHGGRKRPGQ